MNNRKRMIANVYRQNRTLSTRHHFEQVAFAFGDGFFKAIREAADSFRKFVISTNEAVKALDLSGIIELIRKLEGEI